ncbi:hypothetical protein [Acidipropionibacterium timonense]|uniref:hypothetical protein n=1 Tax=Acidipropionibacterium timonense TaxID=2161818 RepID=UPI0010313FBE|nr:hypothetical protein [Acidipropionibacterium timonense]
MTNDSNPAQKLHDRLAQWKTLPEGRSPKAARAIEGRDWIDVHLETLGWFSQVRDRLTDETYAGLVDSIATAIFTDSVGITGSRGGVVRLVGDSDLVALKILADNWGQAGVSGSDLSDVLSATDSVRGLIESADYLDSDAARYLFELAEAIDKAVEEFSIFGPSGVQRLVNELIGALAVHFGEAPADDAQKAGTLIENLYRALRKILHLAAPAAIEGATAGIMQALTT